MTASMRAARFVGPGRPLDLTDRPIPETGPLDVLMRVEACGICLSDVHLIDGSIPPVRPRVIPGHEACGTIASVGSLVSGWNEGDRAAIMGGRYCGRCSRCVNGRQHECSNFEIMGFHYDGAWAEYVLVPQYGLTAVPDGVPIEQAAILADAVATPYAALIDRGGLRPGETVGLWGIGGLGTHAVQIARFAGAGLVVAIDPLPSARERALRVGADVAIDPSGGDTLAQVMSLTGREGLDLTLDLYGSNRTLKEAVSCLRRGGRAIMVGLSVDPVELGPGVLFGTRNTSLLGHLGYKKQHLDELVQLLASGRLDLSGSISEVIPLEQVAEGVRRLADKEGDPVRIIVTP